MILAGNGVRSGPRSGRPGAPGPARSTPLSPPRPAGRACFPSAIPWPVGVIGPFGWPSANAVVGEADVVLAVGTKLGPSDTANEHAALLDPTRQTLIQIDVEPLNAAWTFPVDHVLLGDADYVMARLSQVYESRSWSPAGQGQARAEQARRTQTPATRTPTMLDEFPLLPRADHCSDGGDHPRGHGDHL